MHRCPHEQADLLLDGAAYRFAHEREARDVHNRLAGKRGATFPDFAATLARLDREFWLAEAGQVPEEYTP